MDSTVSLGLSRRIAAIVSAAVARRNGLRPVSISEMTIPTAKMSDRVSVASPRTCSGDMYRRRANDRSRLGQQALCLRFAVPRMIVGGQPEIEDLEKSIAIDEQVFGLDVTVHDALVVGGGESAISWLA